MNQELLDEINALKKENQELRTRLEEAEELKRAISDGDLDALVIPTPEGELVFTLDSADYAYRVLVETMNEGTVTLGFDGTILYCNRRFAELLRMQPQDIVGKSIYRFIAPESEIDFNALLKHKMNAGEVYLKVEDGRSLPTYLSVSSLQAANSPNAWCLVVTDLTEQKKNEEIVASERLARSIIEQAEETIVVCDTSGRIIRFSNSLLKLCGCDPIDQRFEFLLNLRLSEWADESERFLPVSSALRGSIIHGMEAIIERENRQKLIVLLNAGPLKNADGEIIGCTVTLTDITERKHTEEALYNAYQKLKEQSEELKKFGEELQAHSEEVHSQNEELKSQSEEIQKTNEALLESEKKLQAIIDGTLGTISVKDLAGRYILINKRLEEIFGVTREKIKGKNDYDILSPEWAEYYRMHDLKVMETGVPEQIEEIVDLVDGLHTFLANRFLLYNSQGKPYAICSISIDITERKRAEEELTAVHSKIQSIIDNTPDLIYAFDLEGRFVLANAAVASVLNSTPDRMIGKRRHEFMPKMDADWHEVNDQQVFEAGRVLEFEEYSNFEDRSITWLTKKFPLRDAQGRIYAVAGISADITERKRAEETLQESEEKFRTLSYTLEEKVKERTAELENAYNSLKESEQHLAEAQKMAHIGSWELNLKTNKLYWSDEVYRIFGRNPQEFDPTYDTFLNSIHPHDREYVSHVIKEALHKKPYDVDYRIILPDGSERVVYALGGAVFDEKNIPILMRGMVQDITERKRVEEALGKIEIARKQEIHHRIKNNLQVISSLLDLQAEQFRDKECIKDSEVQEAFRESQDRVISMALIHEELYKGGGFETLNFSPYLKELAKNLCHTYNIGNNDISLKLDLSENAFFDMDTAVPLGMIVNELVTNSFKHAFPDKNQGEIRIGLHREEEEECILCTNEDCSNTFTLTVSDNGVGIPESLEVEDVETLGMQLVTTLVDQLDGELELKRNNGTDFNIRFTVRENNDQALSPAQLESVDDE